MDPDKINWFLLFKLPSAWFCGVRVKYIDNKNCKVSVKHRWINQNPFKSMYFAVQNMAAELSTGVLVMQSIKKQKVPISMLVVKAESKFYKKATGIISFECRNGLVAENAIQKCISDDKGQQFTMSVKAYNSDKDVVSEFDFVWSVRAKNTTLTN